MSISILVFWTILQTFLLLCLGAFALKKGFLQSSDLPRLTVLVVDVFTPFLTFSAIIRSFSTEISGIGAVCMPLIGFGVMAVGYLVGLLLSKLLFASDDQRRRTFHHVCTINNYLFLPLMIIQNIWPEDGHVALLLLLNVGSTIGFWTLGIVSMAGSQTISGALRNICSPNMAAILLGLVVSLLDIPLPMVVGNTAKMLGEVAVPFTMVLTGAYLLVHAKSLLSNWKDAVMVNLVRLVLIPAICAGLLKLLPLDRMAYEVTVIYATMPAAVIAVLIAGKYRASEDFAGQSIITTTLLSLVTVPVWMWILL